MSVIKSKSQPNGWVVLLIGLVLGVIGYYFFQQSFAASLTPSKCHGGGGEVDLQGGKLICVGGKFDGVQIGRPA